MNATDFSSQLGGRRVRDGRGAEPWLGVDVPVVEPVGWFLGEIEAGLKQVERLRRSVDAAMALLVAAMPQNRDTTAAIARTTGGSNRESRLKQNVAKVVAKVPGALDALKEGKVSAEHLAALAPVADTPGAAALLAGVGLKSPEELGREAQQMKLSMECGDDVVKRQHKQRFVRFFDGPDGMIGINGLFPPLEGAELKTKLDAVVNARYKAAHPERAKVLGGHGEDTREQRMADALLAVFGIRARWKPPEPKPTAEHTEPASEHHDEQPGTFDADDVGPTPQPNRSGEPSAGMSLRGQHEDAVVHVTPLGPEPRTESPSEPSEVACTCECDVHAYPSPEISLDVGPGIDVSTAKPAHIVVFNVDKWEARLAGGPELPITSDLFDQAKNDLYLCFVGMDGEPLKFGRARREPTAIQRLAVIARDQRCIYPGCESPPQTANVHHLEEVHLDCGPTDVDTLGLLCPPHHQHVHDNDEVITRNPDGTHTVTDRNTGRVIVKG